MGVLKSATGNRRLRVVGCLIIAYSVVNIYWPPMHMRGLEPSLTDTLHIVWAMVTVLFMMVMMVVGAATFGKRFRLYTIASMVLLMGLGSLTSLDAPKIPENLPTPCRGLGANYDCGFPDMGCGVGSYPPAQGTRNG